MLMERLSPCTCRLFADCPYLLPVVCFLTVSNASSCQLFCDAGQLIGGSITRSGRVIVP